MSNQTIKFLGNESQYFDGIPNRDLTQEEWNGLTVELQNKAVASGLYKVPQAVAATPSKKTDKVEE